MNCYHMHLHGCVCVYSFFLFEHIIFSADCHADSFPTIINLVTQDALTTDLALGAHCVFITDPF